MAKPNSFLAKQQALQNACFDAGLRCGRQQILDMMSLVLRDPEIVKKDTFGGERLIKIVTGIGNYIDKYQQAWEKTDETDYYRDKLDAALAEAYGDSLHDSFLQRYEFAPEYDYNTGRWKNNIRRFTMCNYTSWGSIFLFLATFCELKFHSTILWMVFYAVGIICFLLANRQEDKLFKRIQRLESQLAAVTAKISRNP